MSSRPSPYGVARLRGAAGDDRGLGLDVLHDQGHRHPDGGPRPAGGAVHHRRNRPAADRGSDSCRMSRTTLLRGVGLGMLYGIAQILQTTGLAHTSASVSGFITGLYVVATPLLGALILKSRIPRLTWLAAGSGDGGPRRAVTERLLHRLRRTADARVGDHLRRAHRRAGPAERARHGDESQRGADVS